MRGDGSISIPNPRSLVDPEERAVSEVVGAAILIGITVVLATVIAGFVFEFTPDEEQAPSVQIDVSQHLVDKNAGSQTIADDGSLSESDAENYHRDVLQLQTFHRGGEPIRQPEVNVRLRAETHNNTATGHLVGYNDSNDDDVYYNVTEGEWNRATDRSIAVGGQGRYEFFVTEQLGQREDVVPADNVRDLWRRGKCHVDKFNDNREFRGPIVLNDGDHSDDCPLDGDATIQGGTIDTGGRIAPGDVVRITWSPPGATSSSILRTYEVRDPGI